MEEYVEERNNRVNNVKIKGRIMRNQGLKMHNFGKSEKPDHTRDYGKRSGKVNERIARMLRRNERNEGINNIVVDDEYEETIASSYLSSDETVTDFYIPLETARTLSGENKGYESFKIVAKGGTDTAAFLDTVGEYFEAVYSRNDEWTCKATSLESMISTFTDMMDTVSLAIAAIAAISLLVGGIGVMNIMLVSITERTKEIGTRKALGAPNNSIRLQFITESVVICLIGGIIGVAIGLAGGMTISYLLGFYALPSISSIVIALVFSMFIGIVFGYAPANKAAKLNPIDALRYE